MEPLQTSRVFSERYEVTHLIARGGMAQVYRAIDRRLGRPVALKVLFPEFSVDRSFVERFRREAQAAANLSHPNIVPVFDWGEDGSTYFIVMEFVDGRPLSAALKAAGPMPPDRAVSVAMSVSNALGYAHRHGVIHRDVKPGNVLITDEGEVKVTDFGIARAVNTEESLTQTGAVMGTATYFSPEQAEGRTVDARSDIYALGVVLFEMLTGRPPFLGDSPVAVASKHVRDAPPLPRELNPDVPAPLEAVVMKAMAKLPDERYATAAEFREDLQRFLRGQPVLAPMVAMGMTDTHMMSDVTSTQALPYAPEPEQAEDEDGRKRRTRLLLALLGLLIVLGVIVFFLGRSLGYWGGSGIDVPNVTGQSTAAATSSLVSKGLHLGGINRVASSQPRGIVIRTRPPSGTSVSKGSSVFLVVSAGSSATQVGVPNVTGKSLTSAEAILTAAGLTYSTSYSNNGAQRNTVIYQNPSAGSRVGKGTNVSLSVSSGQTTVTVPNVSGDSTSQAAGTLSSYGLQLGQSSYQSSNNYGYGAVIGTDPSAGTSVAAGSTVDLIVSTGSPVAPTTPTSATTTTPTTSPPTSSTTTSPPTSSTTTPPPSGNGNGNGNGNNP